MGKGAVFRTRFTGRWPFVLNVTSDQGDSTPKLGLSFPSADVLRFQFSPLGDVAFEAGAADYSIEEDSNCIIISTSALK